MKSLFTFLFFFPILSFAQNDIDPGNRINTSEKQWGITGAINAGKYVTGSLGIAHGIAQKGFEVWSLSAIGVTAEIIDPKRSAYGFGAEAWFNAYLSMGIALTDYTDLTYSRICLRPMIGVAYGNVRVTYGYNFRLNRNDYKIFNTNMVTLHYFLPVSHKNVSTVERRM